MKALAPLTAIALCLVGGMYLSTGLEIAGSILLSTGIWLFYKDEKV